MSIKVLPPQKIYTPQNKYLATPLCVRSVIAYTVSTFLDTLHYHQQATVARQVSHIVL